MSDEEKGARTEQVRSDPGRKSVESRSDEVLARAAAGGDREAFAALHERFAPLVHGILVASGPRGQAGDGVQEVFLSALRSIDKLADASKIGGWLAAIARNQARDMFRTALPTEPAELDQLAENPGETDNSEEANLVLSAVRELPESYRETLVLRLVEGLSGPEIAERTGMTHGSVRVNLHRGMGLLKERLARLGWEGIEP